MNNLEIKDFPSLRENPTVKELQKSVWRQEQALSDYICQIQAKCSHEPENIYEKIPVPFYGPKQGKLIAQVCIHCGFDLRSSN
jgi:hypothetical protein